MDKDGVYERLAVALGQLPNGFPRTPSNVETSLLKRIFTPEEALIASQLGDKPVSIEEIVRRTGIAPEGVKARLFPMAESGLVWVQRSEGGLLFRLAPFIVGIYEAQLARMDRNLARLIDDYLEDGGAVGIMGAQPAIHRVVPAQAAIKPEWVLPYDDVCALLDTAMTFRVRDCICRLQMEQMGRECDFPLRTCLIYHTVEHPPGPDDIPREAAQDLLDEAEEIGLVHTVSNVRTGSLLPHGVGYICNCCGCCCVVLRGITKWGIENSVAHSSFYAEIDDNECTECGICIERCQIHAIHEEGGRTVLDSARCIGCGLCVTSCPVGAAQLHRRPDDEVSVPPLDFAEWEQERRAGRQG